MPFRDSHHFRLPNHLELGPLVAQRTQGTGSSQGRALVSGLLRSLSTRTSVSRSRCCFSAASRHWRTRTEHLFSRRIGS